MSRAHTACKRLLRMRGQGIFDWRGKLLSTIRTQDVWRECGPCLALPRNALQAMLQAALVRTDVSLGRPRNRLETGGYRPPPSAGPSLDKALAAYAARRRPRVEWVQAQCALRDRMRRLPALARSAILKPFG